MSSSGHAPSTQRAQQPKATQHNTHLLPSLSPPPSAPHNTGDRLDVGEDFELFSLAKIKTAKGLKALGGADASADTVVDEADDPAQQSGGRNGYGDDDDDEEGGAEDGEDYLDRLDAELNATVLAAQCCAQAGVRRR